VNPIGEREKKMKKQIVSLAMLLMILITTAPTILHLNPVFASPSPGPSLITNDSINRINATLGVKAGSVITAKGVITNIGPSTLTNMLVGVYFIEGGGVALPADFSFEYSFDGITWLPIIGDTYVAKPAAAPYQVEQPIGQAGGETLAPGASLSMYLRVTFNNDLNPVKDIWTPDLVIQSMQAWSYQDLNLNRQFDGSGAGEYIYSQPPYRGGAPGSNWDYPVKIDISVVHTAEIDGTGKFYYTIQGAIDAANPGDTIWVYDGIYKEALYITKSLTIKAASKPVVQGSQLFATDYGNREAVIFVKNAANVVLEDLDVEGEGLGPGPTRSYGILYQNSGGGIYNCIVSPNTIGDMYSTAVAAISRSNLIVENCLIENFGRIGVYATNVANILINKNEIIGQIYSADNLVNYGIEIEDYDGPSVAQITKNKIYNCNNTHPSPLWSSAAIIVDIWRMYYLLSPSKVSMEYNKIYNNYEAIEVVSNPLMHAYYNCIFDNAYGVYVDPDLNNYNGTFDARYNWWGDSTGPYHPTNNPSGLGQDVGDYVLFDPWLTSEGFDYHRKNPVVGEPVTFDASLFTAPCSALKTIVSYTWNFDDGNITTTANPIVTHAFQSNGNYDVSCKITYDDQTTYTGWETVYVAKRPYFETKPLHIYGGHIDSEFQVNVTLNDLDINQKAIGAQFRLCYNDTLMEPVDVLKGPYMDLGYGAYLVWIAQNHPSFGPSVIVGILGLPDENGTWHQYAHGNGLLATVVFKVIYRPVEPETAIGKFTLNETMIIDEDLQEIPHNAVADTVYEAMQLKKPTIKVEPEVTTLGLLNKEFSINVTINNLDIDWRTIAVQFRLCYNATLLEFVDITEGSFMKQAGTTLFMWFNEDNVIYGPSVIVGIFIYPDENGTWHEFPGGSGLLATIKFKAIYQERGLEKPPLTCDLTLCETLIINDEIQETPHNIEDGVFYMYPTNIGDINYDGKVDVRDVSRVAAAFGETPGRPRWDPICDIDGNGKIDTKDVATVAHNYGWRSIHDP
jgi:hypothetical protein